MKILKKILKVLLILCIVFVLALTALDIYLIKKPEIEAKKQIEGINEVSSKVSDITINDNVKVIGLGEATHGNKEFQELKLDVLKVLVKDYNVKAFCLEMDYGEGVIINDYINSKGDLNINDVLNKISFDIYKTEQIKQLIEWMKDYNQTTDDKLSFYGFDLQNPDVDLNIILDFIKENDIDFIDLASYSNSYLSGEVSFKDESLSVMFDKLNEFKDELINNSEKYDDLYNYDSILNCIENVLRAKQLALKYNEDSSLVKGGEYRDQMMAKKVIEIKDSLNGARLMIAGHNGHIGYAGSFTKTMGKFIKEELGDSYFAIGTDYFITNCNLPSKNGKRANHKFVSGDILAYQAKDIGTYYLDFSKVNEDSNVYKYINEPIYTGSLGENYSILNKILQDSVRIYCEVNYLFDSMIFVYEVTPTIINY